MHGRCRHGQGWRAFVRAYGHEAREDADVAEARHDQGEPQSGRLVAHSAALFHQRHRQALRPARARALAEGRPRSCVQRCVRSRSPGGTPAQLTRGCAEAARLRSPGRPCSAAAAESAAKPSGSAARTIERTARAAQSARATHTAQRCAPGLQEGAQLLGVQVQQRAALQVMGKACEQRPLHCRAVCGFVCVSSATKTRFLFLARDFLQASDRPWVYEWRFCSCFACLCKNNARANAATRELSRHNAKRALQPPPTRQLRHHTLQPRALSGGRARPRRQQLRSRPAQH